MAPSSSVALDQWRGLALLLVLISHGFYFADRVTAPAGSASTSSSSSPACSYTAPWRSAATAALCGGGGLSACVPPWPPMSRGRPLVWVGLLAVLMAGGVLAAVLDPAGVDKYHFEYAARPMMLGFCCERWKGSFHQLPAGIVRTTTAAFVGGLCLNGLRSRDEEA